MNVQKRKEGLILNYLKQTTLISEIPSGLKQTFHHEFTHTTSKDVILKMKHDNQITDRDLEIVKFIHRFHFATPQQIFDYIHDPSDETETVGSLQARIDKLVHAHVFNKFSLSPVKENRVHQDALIIYCLDFGGKYLLMNFSNEDLTQWFSSENFKTSELIAKDLMAVEFYLRLKEQTDGKIEYFETSPQLQFERTNLCVSFYFVLNIEGVLKYFLCEIARDEEVPMIFRKKIQKYDQFLGSQAWKKYFFDHEAPALLVLTENDALAMMCGQVIDQSSEIQKYRLTTFDRIQKPLDETGAFLRYLPEHQKCKEVKISVFNKDKLQ